jgi:hypothetical protein
MFGRRWRLFRLCGVPVALDASWLFILALLTFSIASPFPALMRDYFGDAALALPSSAYWLMGLIAAVAFFGCILCCTSWGTPSWAALAACPSVALRYFCSAAWRRWG